MKLSGSESLARNCVVILWFSSDIVSLGVWCLHTSRLRYPRKTYKPGRRNSYICIFIGNIWGKVRENVCWCAFAELFTPRMFLLGILHAEYKTWITLSVTYTLVLEQKIESNREKVTPVLTFVSWSFSEFINFVHVRHESPTTLKFPRFPLSQACSNDSILVPTGIRSRRVELKGAFVYQFVKLLKVSENNTYG